MGYGTRIYLSLSVQAELAGIPARRVHGRVSPTRQARELTVQAELAGVGPAHAGSRLAGTATACRLFGCQSAIREKRRLIGRRIAPRADGTLR